MSLRSILAVLGTTALHLLPVAAQSCPDYSDYSQQMHPPFSAGRFNLSYQRPSPSCRTFNSSLVEATITRMTSAIADPDLARLFTNAFPNTLDTAIKWRGVAADNPAEELAFIITGDINAMWLRDSANQMQSYLSLLSPSTTVNTTTGNSTTDTDSLASLYRGVINLQARYLLTFPFCNSFQPPPESGLPPSNNTAAVSDVVFPSYNASLVFECKHELDSLAAFLQISTDYYTSTHDAAFFSRFRWVPAIRAVLSVANAMRNASTYSANGSVNASPYTFTRPTTRTTETLANDGLGAPVGSNTGLIRSAFRPSDDSCTYQLFIPGNMMLARYLASAADIASAINDTSLAGEMKDMAASLRQAIATYGIVTPAPVYGSEAHPIYAYEVDGFGSTAIMDDANIPSLLSAPLFGYVSANDSVYRATRARILDGDGVGVNGNPYYMRGPVLNAVGGPHVGPGRAWPMASIVRVLTSEDEEEIKGQLRMLVGSTDGLGLMHESVGSGNGSVWSRQWFSWANGLFGQMILDLESRKPEMLKMSFQ